MKDQAHVIRWEDPPPSRGHGPKGPRRGRSRFDELADELIANPGRWAVVYDGPSSGASGFATHIRMGQVHCFAPCGDFDATTRHTKGTARVYARYLGD